MPRALETILRATIAVVFGRPSPSPPGGRSSPAANTNTHIVLILPIQDLEIDSLACLSAVAMDCSVPSLTILVLIFL